MAYDLKANAHAALFAWAFENNRDLKSPAGYNYGEQADFWKDYLINDFEAKWRKRNSVKKGFPFAEHDTFHTYHSFMKWHYYMGKLTGKSAYTKEAGRMAKVLWKNEFKETSSDYGEALVWARGVISEGNQTNYPMPTTYAHYVIAEAIDLHFEGFDKYAKDSTLEKMANSEADFVIDQDDFDTFARDIGGGKSRAGLKPSSSSDWRRLSQTNFAEGSWSFLSVWDASSNNRIEEASQAVYQRLNGEDGIPKRIFIPIGMFIKETLRN